MKIDETALSEFAIGARDLHSDAKCVGEAAPSETINRPHEVSPTTVDRRHFLNDGLLSAAAVGLGLGAVGLGLSTVRGLAATDVNVQALRTAAAIENVVIGVYTQAAALPAAVRGAGNPVIQAFMANTLKQHQDHLASFNAALTAMDSTPQAGADAAFQAAVVAPLLSGLKGPGDVVALALKLEDTLSQSFVSYASKVDASGKAFALFAAIAPVEAQHVAVLLAVQGLLLLGAEDLIQLPAPVEKLPAAAGDLAFPHSFFKTGAARPIDEAS